MNVALQFKRASDPFNISGATLIAIRFLKPNGARLTGGGVIPAPAGSNGDFFYQPTTGEFDIAGQWFAQASATISGVVYYSDWIPLYVGDVI